MPPASAFHGCSKAASSSQVVIKSNGHWLTRNSLQTECLGGKLRPTRVCGISKLCRSGTGMQTVVDADVWRLCEFCR